MPAETAKRSTKVHTPNVRGGTYWETAATFLAQRRL